MRALVGDVGGTNARLALAEWKGKAEGWTVLRERHFPSGNYAGLTPILREFLAGPGGGGAAPDKAVLAVAGPVDLGRGRLSNRGWIVDSEEIARETGIPRVRLLNDFSAVGHALPTLPPSSFTVLHEGAASSSGERPPIAIIGPGTGLGQGLLLWNGNRYVVHPSEGGHAEFAPRTPQECRLLEHLWTRMPRVSWEGVVSGPGLVNVYRFLVESGSMNESPETRRAFEAGEPSRVISARAPEGADDTCVEALDLFISAYGSQAGNLALTTRAEGGVFLAGGIAPAIVDRLRAGGFMKAFLDKGPLSDLLERIPVRVILDTRSGLRGALEVAARD